MFQMTKKIVIGIALAAMLLPIGSVCRADDNETAQEYYEAGRRSYEQDRYVEALEHLFAYRAMAGPSLDHDKGFKSELDSAIWYAEEQVKEAYDMVQQWKKDGSLSQVTVKSGGKFDEFGGQTSESDRRQQPSREESYKPAMRSKAPSAIGSKTNAAANVPAKALAPMPSKEVAVKTEERCEVGLKHCKRRYADLRERCEGLQVENHKMREHLRALKKAGGSER